MKACKLLVCVVLLAVGVSCSRDPEVIKRKYVENGNRYFEKGKYKEAAIMYKNALRKDRKYGEAYYRLALTEMKQGLPWNAYRNFKRAVDTNPGNLDARMQAGEIALAAYMANRSRNIAFAKEFRQWADEVLSRDASSAAALRLRGYHKALVENKPEEALADFRRANELKPGDEGIVLPLVETMFVLKQNAAAEKTARDFLATHKTSDRLYYLLYVYLMRENRAADAEQILTLEVANNPKELDPVLRLATHYQLTQRPAEAKAVIEKMVANPALKDARLRAGQFFARIRDFDSALRYFGEGIKAGGPDQNTFRKAVAEIYIIQRRSNEAQRMLDEVLKADPKDEQAKAIRASIQLDTGDPAQVQAALVDLEGAIKQNPKNAVMRFNYARALLYKRQFEQARRQFQEAINLAPRYIAPRLALAEFQYLRGEYGLSLQTARKVLEIDEKNLPARLIESSSLASSGERARAREVLAAVLADFPNSREAQIQIGLLDLAEKNYTAAESVFAKLHQSNPGDLRGLMGLVETHAAQKQFDKSMQVLKAELAKDPSRQQVRVALGNIAFRAGRLDEAISNFKQLVDVNPKSGELYLKLGECYRLKGDTAAAVSAYQRARELRPNDPTTHLQLAVLYDTVGQRDKARPIYQDVLKLQPDNPFALNNLAYLMAETGADLDQALTLAQKAKQRLPDHPDVADTLGWIYIKKNLSDNAIQIFRDLTAKQPDRATFHYHLGLALYQKGDKPAAKQALEVALKKQPTKDETAKIKELIARIG